MNWLFFFSTMIAGIFLLIGFLTPIVSAIVCAGGILFVLITLNGSISIEIYATALAAAIALLGPGAYSLDARFFGRREIIIRKN